VLALRTSFVALLWDEFDPVVEDVDISGGLDDYPTVPGRQVFSEIRRFGKGMTMSLSCWIWSKTEDDIDANLTATWQKSPDVGASWEAVDTSVTRMTTYWSAGTASTTAARANHQYFDVYHLTLQGFIPQDAGHYRLKVEGGDQTPVYSSNIVEIKYDPNP